MLSLTSEEPVPNRSRLSLNEGYANVLCAFDYIAGS